MKLKNEIMRRTMLFFFSISVVLITFSCEKPKPAEDKKEISYFQPDSSVVLAKLTNDELQEIISINSGGPTFFDTLIYQDAYFLDADRDGEYDFKFVYQHDINFDLPYYYFLWFETLDSLNKIIVSNENVGYYDTENDGSLESNSIVNEYSITKTKISIISDCQGCMIIPFTQKDSGYLGLKINKRYGWIRLELNHENKTVIVKDWAISNVENGEILVGQKE